jgi:large subunit ribosomal protein L27
MLKSICKFVSSPTLFLTQKRYATKLSGGSTGAPKNAQAKHLGIKTSNGQKIKTGGIIIRQKGNKFWPGFNVGQGRDFTLYALNDGFVEFHYDQVFGRSYVNVAQSLAERKINGIPVKRIPFTQTFKIPKIKNFQIQYVVDPANIAQKGRTLRSLRRTPSDIREPTRRFVPKE